MCENIFFVIDILHVVIPVLEVQFILVTCKTVVTTMTWWLWEERGGSGGGGGCVSQSVITGNFYDPIQNTHTQQLYSWDELNNWKEHGLLNYVLQRNSNGITLNILAKQSVPKQYWKIRPESTKNPC
jgi:hypothetical protein